MESVFTFNNRFISELAADESSQVVPRQVEGAAFSWVKPTPVKQPQLVAVAKEVAEQLAISESQWHSQEFAEVFAGNRLLNGMQPFAMCYGGHQFGHWAGQLGDGRAINLGEVIDINGDNQTLQLKGAGLTPYSRRADGLAVLRSSVREFLCSEAMFHLGVPTTRALSLVLTGEQVLRDMFYDGNAEYEPGAVVCRVAPSFVRFGNFQIFAARDDQANLKKLADFTIRHDFPELGEPSQAVYEAWFDRICRLTAEMIVHWMRVGFVHGVMNTDNMSILGLTIDYGPYGWLEGYDTQWTPNTTDAEGRRYSYGNQPQVAQWNLFQLANALVKLVGRSEQLEKSLQDFADIYTLASQQMYAAKLGLDTHRGESDQELINGAFEVLSQVETDMTLFFRRLSQLEKAAEYSDEDYLNWMLPCYYDGHQLNESGKAVTLKWFGEYHKRIRGQEMGDSRRRELMDQTNPKYVLRNYLAQQAIDKANAGDFSEIEILLEVMRQPYAEQPEYERYAALRPEWARHKAGCSMLSCSS